MTSDTLVNAMLSAAEQLNLARTEAMDHKQIEYCLRCAETWLAEAIARAAVETAVVEEVA